MKSYIPLATFVILGLFVPSLSHTLRGDKGRQLPVELEGNVLPGGIDGVGIGGDIAQGLLLDPELGLHDLDLSGSFPVDALHPAGLLDGPLDGGIIDPGFGAYDPGFAPDDLGLRCLIRHPVFLDGIQSGICVPLVGNCDPGLGCYRYCSGDVTQLLDNTYFDPCGLGEVCCGGNMVEYIAVDPPFHHMGGPGVLDDHIPIGLGQEIDPGYGVDPDLLLSSLGGNENDPGYVVDRAPSPAAFH